MGCRYVSISVILEARKKKIMYIHKFCFLHGDLSTWKFKKNANLTPKHFYHSGAITTNIVPFFFRKPRTLALMEWHYFFGKEFHAFCVNFWTMNTRKGRTIVSSCKKAIFQIKRTTNCYPILTLVPHILGIDFTL